MGGRLTSLEGANTRSSNSGVGTLLGISCQLCFRYAHFSTDFACSLCGVYYRDFYLLRTCTWIFFSSRLFMVLVMASGPHSRSLQLRAWSLGDL